MKIKIQTTQQIEKEINIELPFYAKHDLSDDGYSCVHYMKIEEKKITTIERHQDWQGSGDYFKIKVEKGAVLSGHYCYIEKPEHHSSKSQFDNAEKKMREFIKKHLK